MLFKTYPFIRKFNLGVLCYVFDRMSRRGLCGFFIHFYVMSVLEIVNSVGWACFVHDCSGHGLQLFLFVWKICSWGSIMDKKLHKACSGTRDIISSMPDDVLVRILSCLKTKDAIKTCVLSTRWKDLWTFIFNLEFDDFNFGDDKTFKFQNYVEKVLSKCQCGDIQSFRLRCSIVGDDELSYPIQWIIFAIEHKVRKLIVSVDIDYDDDEFWSFRLPQSILSCNTLVELTILSDFYFDISDSMTCFPSLKVLYLSSPHPDVDMMQNLFRSCPVLEDLTIYWNVYSITEDALTFNILVPTLKWLKIHMFMDLHDFEEIPVHKFVVTARELQYLMIDDSVLASYVVNESPLLNEASLSVGLDISDIWWFKENLKLDWYEISKDKVNPVMELLSGVKYTKTLSLSSGTMNVTSVMILFGYRYML